LIPRLVGSPDVSQRVDLCLDDGPRENNSLFLFRRDDVKLTKVAVEVLLTFRRITSRKGNLKAFRALFVMMKPVVGEEIGEGCLPVLQQHKHEWRLGKPHEAAAKEGILIGQCLLE
jgi:hypothetical protein